jgi:hypothetical protein
VEVETDRHTRRPAGGDVEPALGRQLSGTERIAVLDEIALLKERTAVQRVRITQGLRAEPGLLKAPLVVGTAALGVLQHPTEFLQLILLNSLRCPTFTGDGQRFERGETGSEPPAFGQHAVQGAAEAPQGSRQALVKA